MISLGLIGKDIAHSKSAHMYRELLKQEVDYRLFDYPNDNSLPDLRDLFKKVQGLSITAPYKEAFSGQIDITHSPVLGVNCLRLSENKIEATNTDYIALKDILSKELSEGRQNFYILGDGVMGRLTKLVLAELGHEAQIFSRKMQNLSRFFEKEKVVEKNTMIINSLSREYTITKIPDGTYHFWDLNYSIQEHLKLFQAKNIQYTDGIGLLYLQAKYALSFWNL